MENMSDLIARARALLEKYRKGQCTEQEIAILQQWYDQLDVPRQTGAPLFSPEALEARLEAAILARINKPATLVRRLRVPLVAAASITGLLLLSGAWWLLQRSWNARSLAIHTVINDSSTVKKMVLSDGTQVWLNAHTSLRWQDDFGKDTRTVQLEGEGYFNIAKDAAHPFLVKAGGVTTRVLGTAFNIEAYAGEAQLRVALVSGKVALQQDNAEQPASILLPGQVGILHNGQAALQVTTANTAAYSAWTNGDFVLTDVPLEDAIHRICDHFGYSLKGRLPEAVRNERVTDRFGRENAEEVITSILYIHHIGFSIATTPKILTIQP